MKSSFQKMKELGADPVNSQARAFLSRRKPKSTNALHKKRRRKRVGKNISSGKDGTLPKEPPERGLKKKRSRKSKHKPLLDIFAKQALAKRRGKTLESW